MSQKLKVKTYHKVWSQYEQNESFVDVPLTYCRTLLVAIRIRYKVFSVLQFLCFSFGV